LTELNTPANYQAPGLFTNVYETGQTWVDAHSAYTTLSAVDAALNSADSQALATLTPALDQTASTYLVQVLNP
jgi:hypothetical protein